MRSPSYPYVHPVSDHKVRERRLAGTPVGIYPGLLATAVFLLALFPQRFTYGVGTLHTGIAPGGFWIAPFALLTMMLVVLIGLGSLYFGRSFPVPLTVLMFVAALLSMYLFVWPGSPVRDAGIELYVLAAAAVVVGAFLGPLALATPARVQFFAGALLLIAAIEAMACTAQRLGLPLNPMDTVTASLMGARTNGTTIHPAISGKHMFLVIVLALGLLGADRPRTRQLAWTTILACFVSLALSQGRANILAALFAVTLWSVLSSGNRAALVRVGLPIAAVAVLLPFAGPVFERVRDDPNGGIRPHLKEVALDQIAMRPLSGTGPNAYVDVVGAYDSTTRAGFPVHNAFLLTAAELGIPLAVLFWTPVVGLILISWRTRRSAGLQGSFAVAWIAAIPGLYVILSTGWGMLVTYTLCFWCLVMGVIHSQVRPRHKSAATR